MPEFILHPCPVQFPPTEDCDLIDLGKDLGIGILKKQPPIMGNHLMCSQGGEIDLNGFHHPLLGLIPQVKKHHLKRPL